jgi:hypothetical protein
MKIPIRKTTESTRESWKRTDSELSSAPRFIISRESPKYDRRNGECGIVRFFAGVLGLNVRLCSSVPLHTMFATVSGFGTTSDKL